jgi:hypothetical protein
VKLPHSFKKNQNISLTKITGGGQKIIWGSMEKPSPCGLTLAMPPFYHIDSAPMLAIILAISLPYFSYK